MINETDAFPAAGGTTGSSLREAAEVNLEVWPSAESDEIWPNVTRPEDR